MEVTTITFEEFKDMLSESGHDSEESNCLEAMVQFADQYNSDFQGKDDRGNPTKAKVEGNTVIISYVESSEFSEGDIDGIIESFFDEL